MIFTDTTFASDNSPVTVDVVGYARVEGGERSHAREDALKNSFRVAIEQVVGVMVYSKTVINDSLLLQDKIFSKSAGFIKNYKIINEIFESDECRVNVRAIVSAVRLEKSLKDVGLLSKKLGMPRIAVVIKEQNIGNDSASAPLGDGDGSSNAGIAESILYDFIEKKGYNLVDRDTLVAHAKQSGALTAVGTQLSSSEAAIQAAAGGGAEVVIIGQAIAKSGSTTLSGTNMRTSEATVSVRVVDADTGQLLASHSSNARSAHVNPIAGGSEAIRKATKEVAENIHKKIVAKWHGKVSGTRTARLVFQGMDFENISKFQEMLREQIDHVESTVERGFKDGVLTLDAEINGNARELAEELTNSELNGLRFKVLSFTGNTLKVLMQK